MGADRPRWRAHSFRLRFPKHDGQQRGGVDDHGEIRSRRKGSYGPNVIGIAQMSTNFAPHAQHALDLRLDIPRPLFPFQLGLQGPCNDGGQTFARQFGKTGRKPVGILALDIQLRSQ